MVTCRATGRITVPVRVRFLRCVSCFLRGVAYAAASQALGALGRGSAALHWGRQTHGCACAAPRSMFSSSSDSSSDFLTTLLSASPFSDGRGPRRTSASALCAAHTRCAAHTPYLAAVERARVAGRRAPCRADGSSLSTMHRPRCCRRLHILIRTRNHPAQHHATHGDTERTPAHASRRKPQSPQHWSRAARTPPGGFRYPSPRQVSLHCTPHKPVQICTGAVPPSPWRPFAGARGANSTTTEKEHLSEARRLATPKRRRLHSRLNTRDPTRRYYQHPPAFSRFGASLVDIPSRASAGAPPTISITLRAPLVSHLCGKVAHPRQPLPTPGPQSGRQNRCP